LLEWQTQVADKTDVNDPPDPIEAIKFRMERQGLTRNDLKESLARARASPRF
jgi:antitoxin component HigA of HigAB toxin-antitoxin module